MKFEKGDIVYWMGSDKAFGIVLGECKHYKGSYRLYANGSYDTHSSCSGENIRHVTNSEKQLLLSALSKENKYYCEETKTIKEMKKEFTKKDLKSGMWVELRNGERMLCIDNCETYLYGTQMCLISDKGFRTLCAYNDDLTNISHEYSSIDKVYYDKINANTYKVYSNPLIWKRKTEEDNKMKEMQNKLEEMKKAYNELEKEISETIDKLNGLNK